MLLSLRHLILPLQIAPADLVHLPNYRPYIRLMVNWTVSRPFSARAREPDCAAPRMGALTHDNDGPMMSE